MNVVCTRGNQAVTVALPLAAWAKEDPVTECRRLRAEAAAARRELAESRAALARTRAQTFRVLASLREVVALPTGSRPHRH